MSNKTYSELVALRLLPQDFQRLRKIAETNSRKISDMARIIVVAYLNNNHKKEKTT